MSAGMTGSRERLEEEGFRFFNIGADVVGMAGYLQSVLSAFANDGAGKTRETKG
jgi:hypothetical protein